MVERLMEQTADIMRRETYAQIVERVHGVLLTAEGRNKIRQRRSADALMAVRLRELMASGWERKAISRRVGSDRTVFSVTQGALHRATNGLVVSVELRGYRVGTLLPPRVDQGYPTLMTVEPEARELIWGGSEARAYIRACASMKSPQPERELWGVTIQALLGSPKHELLRSLRPVRPAKCIMELPTAVNLQGCIGTGNIDFLARTGRGRSTTFVICELKAERTKPYDAMVQAIHYAVALDVVVNGIPDEIEPADRSIYRTLFESSSTALDPFRFGAMAIIPNGRGVKASAQKALDDLCKNSAWLDVMVFDRSDDGQFQPVCRFRDRK